ncbi:hypothetical protein LR066_05280 [candidate division WOR-3 bacterium]|nr:hypothetical protein [candidate division WOR-3 bacterium]
MIFLYLVILAIPVWSTDTWDGGGGQFIWNDTSMYLYSEGLCGGRFHGKIVLYTPYLSEPHFVNLEGLKELHVIIQLPDGRILIAGEKNNSGVIYLSEDGGYTWSEAVLPPDILSVRSLTYYDGKFIAGVTDIHNRGYILLSDNGISWTLESGHMEHSILSLLVRADGYGFAGTGNRGWLYWTNFAKDWSGLTVIGLLGIRTINHLYQTSSGRIYAATRSTTNEGRVFYSDIGGTGGWELIPSIFGQSAYSIAEDDKGNLYVGTGDFDGRVFVIREDIVSGTPATGTQRVNSVLSDFDGDIYIGATSFEGGVNVGRILVFSNGDWVHSVKVDTLRAIRVIFITQDGKLVFGGEGSYIGVYGHRREGFLVSSIYDVGTDNGSVRYRYIDWDGTLNGGAITVRVRTGTSTDTSQYLPWEYCPPLEKGQFLEGVNGINPGDRYIQYRVDISSPSSALTPLFHNIRVFYTIDTVGPIITSTEVFMEPESYPYIDSLDLVFSEPTNRPDIYIGNIDRVLSLSNNHSWLSSDGFIGGIGWVSDERLRIRLLFFGDTPATVRIGDMIYPDSSTIRDEYENPSVRPVAIKQIGIEEREKLRITNYELRIYPNPFRGFVRIAYSVMRNASEKHSTPNALRPTPYALRIYDLSARLIRTIPITEHRLPITEVTWDGRDKQGNEVKSGVYFIRLEGTSFQEITEKVILIR